MTPFDLNAMLGSTAAMENEVKQIPCDMLVPYHNHRFELYSGERLEDMIESIKENGVLCPIVVQPLGDKYEILIGHNRVNASKLAGLPTVPAIIKTGLSEEEAEMYVIESNIMQRGFDNLRISEQAAVIALRHSEMFSQGKRNDILRELSLLENPNAKETDKTLSPPGAKLDLQDLSFPTDKTLSPPGAKLDSGKTVGAEYGISKRSVARLIRIDKLVEELKEFVDNGTISIRSGVELSFLSKDTQFSVANLAEEYKVDIKKAEQLREAADSEGCIDSNTVYQIISDNLNTKPKSKSVKLSHDIYSKYFDETTKSREIVEIIEKALQLYFEKN